MQKVILLPPFFIINNKAYVFSYMRDVALKKFCTSFNFFTKVKIILNCCRDFLTVSIFNVMFIP